MDLNKIKRDLQKWANLLKKKHPDLVYDAELGMTCELNLASDYEDVTTDISILENTNLSNAEVLSKIRVLIKSLNVLIRENKEKKDSVVKDTQLLLKISDLYRRILAKVENLDASNLAPDAMKKFDGDVFGCLSLIVKAMMKPVPVGDFMQVISNEAETSASETTGPKTIRRVLKRSDENVVEELPNQVSKSNDQIETNVNDLRELEKRINSQRQCKDSAISLNDIYQSITDCSDYSKTTQNFFLSSFLSAEKKIVLDLSTTDCESTRCSLSGRSDTPNKQIIASFDYDHWLVIQFLSLSITLCGRIC